MRESLVSYGQSDAPSVGTEAPTIGAIDIGSNAIRLAIGVVEGGGRLRLVEKHREPVRLGTDVFTGGTILPGTMDRALDAFDGFRARLTAQNVGLLKAVGTSAVREAGNRARFVEKVQNRTGIPITVISGAEEARLIYLAIEREVELREEPTILIDIGGGSVEISIAEQGGILTTESHKLGTVRLLEELKGKGSDEATLNRLLEETADAARQQIRRDLGRRELVDCIGTGGNVEALGELRVQLLGKKENDRLTLDELNELIEQLESWSYEERIQELNLRPDRADVIIPAALVLRVIIEESGVGMIRIPDVGLKNGILQELVSQIYGRQASQRRSQILASARGLGLKYAYDEEHAVTVADFATRVFDATRPLHGLGPAHRLLLEVAALLHDIGRYVNGSGHHKHSCYLIRSSPFVGLTKSEKEIVANVARYHRKAFPKKKHDHFRNLSSDEKDVVRKLSALLRLANALDVEHGNKVEELEVRLGNGSESEVVLELQGDGELLLERWVLSKRGALFEHVFDRRLVVR